MPADYKSYNSKKKNRKAKNGRKHLLLWIIIPVVIILFGFILYWLSENGNIKMPIKKIAHKSVIAAKKIKKEVKTKLVPPEVKFEFYDLLPKEQVTVPGTTTSATAVNNAQPVVNNSRYLLQVASLKKFIDADSMKANLIMKGFAAQVKKINVNNNIWYRVLIGPFNSMDATLNAQNKLRKDNKDTIIRKIKS